MKVLKDCEDYAVVRGGLLVVFEVFTRSFEKFWAFFGYFEYLCSVSWQAKE
jgi:hypothetical protein